MTSISEIKERIANSTGRDWEFFDDPEIYVYSPNPRIRIEEQGASGEYYEPWLEPYHHSDDVQIRAFRVYFGSSPIDQLRILWIDEGRFNLPRPYLEPDIMQIDSEEDVDLISITPYEEGIARAMSRVSPQRFDAYLSQGGITVQREG